MAALHLQPDMPTARTRLPLCNAWPGSTGAVVAIILSGVFDWVRAVINQHSSGGWCVQHCEPLISLPECCRHATAEPSVYDQTVYMAVVFQCQSREQVSVLCWCHPHAGVHAVDKTMPPKNCSRRRPPSALNTHTNMLFMSIVHGNACLVCIWDWEAVGQMAEMSPALTLPASIGLRMKAQV